MANEISRIEFGSMDAQQVCDSCYHALTGRSPNDKEGAYTCSGCGTTNRKGVKIFNWLSKMLYFNIFFISMTCARIAKNRLVRNVQQIRCL